MSSTPWTPEAEAAAGLAALRRARVRAEEIARATGTLLVFAENGRVVHVRPGAPAAPSSPAAAVAEPVVEYRVLPLRKP
mgnify:CR=1 FL=1